MVVDIAVFGKVIGITIVAAVYITEKNKLRTIVKGHYLGPGVYSGKSFLGRHDAFLHKYLKKTHRFGK